MTGERGRPPQGSMLIAYAVVAWCIAILLGVPTLLLVRWLW